ncbi:MAG: thioesterase family protein [Pseudomonadota bacterium]
MNLPSPQDGWTETGRGVVNSWDCDENAHFNIQGYLSAFDVAGRHFALVSADGSLSAERTVRHIRYHAEMPAGEPFVVHSRYADGPYTGTVEHRMTALGNTRLAATCLDGYNSALQAENSPLPAPSDDALGRGLPPDPAALVRPDITEGRGLVTHRGVVTPAECGPDGWLLDRFYFARVSDAAPHIWGHAGFTHDWLIETTAGRVAMEIKLTYGMGLQAGDLIHIESGLIAIAAKTFTLRHVMVRSRDGAVAAIAEGVVLVMHLDTRKVIPIPDVKKDALAGRLLS